MPWRQLAHKWSAVVVGLVLAILVIGPMLSGGWPLLLDTVRGPHPKFPTEFFGFNGGVFQPLTLLLYALNRIAGPVSTWLPFACFFPIAVYGMSRVVEGGRVAKIAAGLFFSLTPVAFDRIWVGHAGYLLGYALLPYVLHAIRNAFKGHRIEWVKAGGWIALAAAASPHFLWISFVLLVGMLIAQRPSRELYAGGAIAVMLAGLMSAYLLPSSHADDRAITVDNRDLSAFATHAVGNQPLIVTVSTLRGFWRGADPQLPMNTFPGRPLLLLVGLLIILIGIFRKNPDKRQTFGLFLAGVFALFLAMGTQGPTGSIFQFAFDHVPGFAIMREPQKFVAVWALFGASMFGAGVEQLGAQRTKSAFVIAVVAAIAVPAALSPGIYWGYGNRVHGLTFPKGWTEANKAMGNGDGQVLTLPWHQYESFPFTAGRIVANPIPFSLDRDAIVGDNVELPGLDSASASTTSAYLSYLYKNGNQVKSFGALVAPLNVQYVFLAKTVNWNDYSWLRDQKDLRVVSDNDDVTIFENTKWCGYSYATSHNVTVADWGELVGYANSQDDVRGVMVRKLEPGDVRTPSVAEHPHIKDNAAKKPSHTTIRVLASASGDTTWISEPFHQGWSARGAQVSESPAGTLVVSTSKATDLHFRPWARYLLADVISVTTTIVVVGVVIRRRQRTS